jgi:hypothetical protein
MRDVAVAVVACALTVFAGHVLQGSSASADSQTGRAADLAAIEKLWQQDIAATVSRDPVALTDLWTDDAIRLGAGAPADVGGKAIRESNERQTANKGFKVLSYVPESKDFTFLDGGWVCRLAGWRGEAGSWHGAGGAQEAPGRQLESLPRDGEHGARYHWQSRWLVRPPRGRRCRLAFVR